MNSTKLTQDEVLVGKITEENSIEGLMVSAGDLHGTMAMAKMADKPIPNNYGLITWNGSFITVS